MRGIGFLHNYEGTRCQVLAFHLKPTVKQEINVGHQLLETVVGLVSDW